MTLLVCLSCLFAVLRVSSPTVLDWSCKENVDVVITVHNSLRALKNCFRSLEASEIHLCTSQCFCATIFVIDANSSFETADFLETKAVAHPKPKHVKYHYVKQKSSSYTSAVNSGIACGSSDTVIILNSDIILPSSWISDLTSALYSSPFVGMVGPLSNSACYQSLPDVTPRSWSHNAIPQTISVQDVDNILKNMHPPEYPPVSILNGFTFALRRRVVDTVGYFDDVLFPIGYGEENDYSLRVRKAGFSLRVVDNLFVFHEKSASFGQSRRSRLIRSASHAYSHELAEYIRLAYEELFNHVSLRRRREALRRYYTSTRNGDR